jgi:Flp pilus assembly pilin Flp
MLDYLRTWVALKTDNRGVTALEYAIIAGVLGIGLVGIFTTFKGSLESLFTTIGTDI